MNVTGGRASAAGLMETAARRFEQAGVYFGHGTDNAGDEAAFLVLHALAWPFDVAPDELQRPLTPAEIAAVEFVIQARIDQRVPAAYLTHRMWFAGLEFYVDERVLVPRSPLAELIEGGFQPWLGMLPVRRILDIGTGSGCIAIAMATAFPSAQVDATDISEPALAVAAINRDRHGLAARLELMLGDLFPPPGPRYDIIVSNPPYVPDERVAELPQEYRNEPRLALAAGDDGLSCVRRILANAPDYLNAGGLLIVEVGEIADDVATCYPNLPFTWVEFVHGGEGVFVLTREELVRGC